MKKLIVALSIAVSLTPPPFVGAIDAAGSAE